MNETIQGMIDASIYVVIGVAVGLIGMVLFSLCTKMREKKLILEDGNVAVGLNLAGKLIGLGIVISSAASYSVNLVDYILFSAYGILAQIIVFLIAEFIVFPRVTLGKKIEDGNNALAIVLFALSIIVGLIIRGAITP